MDDFQWALIGPCVAPPAEDGWVHGLDSDSDEARQLPFVETYTFEATFSSSPTPVDPSTVRPLARIRR